MRRDLLALGLGLGLLACLTVPVAPSLMHEDQGRDLYSAWRASLGEIPYRDYQWVYGPLFLGYYALLFKLLSPSILAMHAGYEALQWAACLFTFLSARSLYGRLLAFACAAFQYAFLEPYHTFNHAGTAALFSLLLYLFLRLSAARPLSRGGFLALAAVAGLLYQSKLTMGAAATAGVALFVALAHRQAGFTGLPWARLAILCVALPLASLVPYLALMAPQPLERWPMCWNLAFGRYTWVYPYSWEEILAAPRLLLAGSFEAAMNRAHLSHLLLPLTAGTVLAWSVRRSWRFFARREGAFPLLPLVAPVAFVLLMHEFFGPRNPHTLGYHLSGMNALVLAGLFHWAGRLRRWLCFVPAVCLLVFPFARSAAIFGKLLRHGAYWDHPRAQVWCWDTPYGDTMLETARTLERLADPGEPVGVLPRGSLYLFLAGRRRAHWIDEASFVFMTRLEEERILAELRPARLLLLTNFTRYLLYPGCNLGEGFGRRLMDGIQRDYVEIDRVPRGRDLVYGVTVPFDFNHHQVRFLQRRPRR